MIRPARRRLLSISLLMSLAAFTAGTGCSAEPPEDTAPSWNEFREAAARQIDGREVYVVEGDQALTLEELRAYYEDATADRGRGLGPPPASASSSTTASDR